MSREYPCVYYDNEKCTKFCVDGVTSYCVRGSPWPCKYQVLSNADRIRAMSDEELAEFIIRGTERNDFYIEEAAIAKCDGWLEKGELLDWIRQPAEDEQHG